MQSFSSFQIFSLHKKCNFLQVQPAAVWSTMPDVHSSEASEACSYVALYLVYYFCVTVSDIEITAKQNVYEQY